MTLFFLSRLLLFINIPLFCSPNFDNLPYLKRAQFFFFSYSANFTQYFFNKISNANVHE